MGQEELLLVLVISAENLHMQMVQMAAIIIRFPQHSVIRWIPFTQFLPRIFKQIVKTVLVAGKQEIMILDFMFHYKIL